MRLAFAVLLLLAATSTRADVAGCEKKLVQQGARYAAAAAKALARCTASVVAGELPAGTACASEPRTVSTLARARSRSATAIARACCGPGGTCGDGIEDVTPGDLGWSPAACPDLERAGCTAPIATTGDVAGCVACVDAAAAGAVMTATHAALGAVPPDAAIATCRRTIVEAMAKLFGARSKALARCWLGRLRGRHAAACPLPGDGRAAPAIAAAEAAAATAICAACGGADRQCGGGDDLTPAGIGFPVACPDAIPPDGASCARGVASLGDVVACTTCLTALAGECADRLLVPEFAGYPAACEPPPLAPGATCGSALDCPLGYGCADNGTGTRYCIGPPCALDADCAGGGVCRRECTLAGCEAQRCQTPGFGCAGPEELCIADGPTRACYRLCTTDSDCTGPFAFVCVNPGFGAGVCIGTVPCE
jgi:hypothetical protein